MNTYSFQTILILLITTLPNFVFACWKTQLEYEISRNCEVSIISMASELESLENESHWLAYLQHKPSSIADENAGVPQTARIIFRSGDSLYCELDENGLISEAYTLPTKWIDSEQKWISLGKYPVEVDNGLLPVIEFHKSEVTTCY